MNSNKNNLVFSFDDEDQDEPQDEIDQIDRIDEYVERFISEATASEAVASEATGDFVISEATSEEPNQIYLAHQYDASYSAKDLLKICEFYGFHKECKKYKKMELIYAILLYESDPINAQLVEKRKAFWEFMELLKQDKFMKRFIVW